MTRIFIVRHGVTHYNVDGIFQGSLDIPLNIAGERQAELLCRRFAEIQISNIYSSPLQRTMLTAEKIASVHNIIVRPIEGLREINGGKFEGRPAIKNKSDYPDQFHNMKYSCKDFQPPDGESFKHLYNRVLDAFKKILQQESGKTIIIVTHFFPSLAMINYLEGLDIENAKIISVQNASVSLFKSYDNITFNTVFLNDISHLLIDDESNLIYGTGIYFAE